MNPVFLDGRIKILFFSGAGSGSATLLKWCITVPDIRVLIIINWQMGQQENPLQCKNPRNRNRVIRLGYKPVFPWSTAVLNWNITLRLNIFKNIISNIVVVHLVHFFIFSVFTFYDWWRFYSKMSPNFSHAKLVIKMDYQCTRKTS